MVSLLPLLLSTIYNVDRLDRPSSRLYDQDFGVGLRPEQLLIPRSYYQLSPLDRSIFDFYYRPLPDIFRPSDGGAASRFYIDKDTFKAILDVKQFKPEEIEVKVVDKYIVITGEHEEKQDEHGLISRQFVRKYKIPDNVEPDTIKSEISSDGVLTISAPVKEIPENKNERKVTIEYTGKPAIKHQDNSNQDNKIDKENKEDGITIETPTSTQEPTSTTTAQ